MSTGRLSLRQAVVVLPATREDIAAAPLARALGPDALGTVLSVALLDVVGVLVRVDGVTLAVIAPVEDVDRMLVMGLPAGIEVIGPGRERRQGGDAEQLLAAALRSLLDERQFDRVVAVSGDVIGLTTRVVATALSCLDAVDLSLGPSPGGAGYLVGVRDRSGIATLAEVGTGPFGGAKIAGHAGERGLTSRRVEPLPRVTELSDHPALVAAVERESSQVPRLAEVLRQMTS